ncbi:MAG: hypothetical protein VYA34_01125 [Myxococcota bacterium]|nr:hypothetical protein [Myxococcota bacterium]
MKSVIGWFLALALVVGAGGFGLKTYRDTNREHAYELKLRDLKVAFERKSLGLALVEKDKYVTELGVHLTRYFNEIRKLGKEYPDLQDIERQYKYGENRLEKGFMTLANKEARDERIKLSLHLMEKMKMGQYRPLYTSVDKAFRFDIYDISPAKLEGQDGIKFAFVHWGAYGPVQYDMIEGTFEVEQEKGKPVEIPQILGEGQPPTLQLKPEKWVNEFFPGIEVGYYLFPKFPQQAKAINLKFDFSIRSVGGSSIPIKAVFPPIAIADAWKIGEGKEWRAQERFVSDEELKRLGKKPQVSTK